MLKAWFRVNPKQLSALSLLHLLKKNVLNLHGVNGRIRGSFRFRGPLIGGLITTLSVKNR